MKELEHREAKQLAHHPIASELQSYDFALSGDATFHGHPLPQVLVKAA